MKHNRLKQSLERAKEVGLNVIRRHREGKTLITITSGNGEACGKAYTTGNASGQAGFINRAVKSWRLVETGTMHRFPIGVLFFTDTHNIIYAWNEKEKQWQIANGGRNAFLWQQDVISTHKVRVDVNKLASGITHPDW